jgi:hypothetical protein
MPIRSHIGSERTFQIQRKECRAGGGNRRASSSGCHEASADFRGNEAPGKPGSIGRDDSIWTSTSGCIHRSRSGFGRGWFESIHPGWSGIGHRIREALGPAPGHARARALGHVQRDAPEPTLPLAIWIARNGPTSTDMTFGYMKLARKRGTHAGTGTKGYENGRHRVVDRVTGIYRA